MILHRGVTRPGASLAPKEVHEEGSDIMDMEQVNMLLYEALETEQGGILVYRAAIASAINPDLKQEWTEYLEQPENHERVLLELFETLGLDPDAQTPGRAV